MKKYRLIEHNPNNNSRVVSVGIWDNDAQAANAMFSHIIRNPSLMYSIEVEEGSIMDRVKTYEDACKVFGEEPTLLQENLCIGKMQKKDYILSTNYAQPLPDHIIALLKLEIITAALNEGWKPDWENERQYKWFIYYAFKRKQVSISYSTCEPQMPPILYFKSKELAEYAAKQFADLYKELLIKNF